MKKYFVLTSVLALCACGGGGGGSNPGVPQQPDGPRAATLLGAANQNSEITSMASAVIVKNDGSYSSTARSAAAPDTTIFNGYTVYKLNNVDFKLIEDQDSAFNFDINADGRITSVTTKLGGQEGSADRDSTETGKFNGRIFQFVDGDREIITITDDGNMTQARLDEVVENARTSGKITDAQAASGKWNHLIQKWRFEHSNPSDGLTYSDFGYMVTQNVTKEKDITINSNGTIVPTSTSTNTNEGRLIFAGGYDIPNNPTNGMTFTGKAVGIVTSSVLNDTSSLVDSSRTTYGHTDVDAMAALETSQAHLVFNEGNEVLTLPFGSSGTATDVESGNPVDWYDVTVTKAGNSTTFAFDAGDRTIPTRFRTDDTSAENTTINKRNAAMGYYGVGTPVEATGAVEYMTTKDLSPSDAINRDVREFHFQAGYGLKKD